MGKSEYSLLILGLFHGSMAAFFMLSNDVLGERTTQVATILTMVGIGMIASWFFVRTRILKRNGRAKE